MREAPTLPDKEYVDGYIDWQEKEIKDLEKLIDEIDKKINEELNRKSDLRNPKINKDSIQRKPKQQAPAPTIKLHDADNGPHPGKGTSYAGPDAPGPNITNTA
ncbi:hypothetical protein D9M68_779070 [compost metagenome]